MTATRPPGYDDRSAAPVEASRRGAHRARPKAIAAVLPVLAGIVVVLMVIGGVYTLLGDRSAPKTNTVAEKALDEDTGDTGADPSASADDTKGDNTKGGDADKPADEATPSAETSAEPTQGNAGGSPVDKTVALVVLNSINVGGLAAEVKAEMENQGWTVERTGNSTNRDLPVTKVYYGKAENKATAKAVRKALGYGQITEDSGVTTNGITVVLGQDSQ